MPVDQEVEVSAVNDILNVLSIEEFSHYEMSGDTISAVKINTENATLELPISSLFKNEISYDYIKLLFDESGRMISICFGDTNRYEISY